MATVTQIKQKVKTIDIKGKPYVEVNERVRVFRSEPKFENWTIETDIYSLAGGTCVFKATIKDANGIIKSTGFAYEKEGSTFINKTSFIENAETSAVGRALGFLGIGIDYSIASAEEVQNAQLNQAVQQQKVCPKCGKPTSTQALENWGMCAECKKKQKIAGQLPPA